MSSGTPLTVSPASTTVPARGPSRPATQRSRVVLPQPDGPTMQTSSAGRAEKLRSSITVGAEPSGP